ncbi:hypothetical protein EDC94DRAFT_594157 [Helicostylum pulchrum]|nr:hypothetical protein EDC94DRAFT_594157 [Helicostylum pulchrum]
MYDIPQQVSVPPSSSGTDYYHTKPTSQSYDNYAHHQNDQTSIYPYSSTTAVSNPTSVYQQQQQQQQQLAYSQPIVSSTPIATPVTRLSNINLTSQAQEFNHNTSSFASTNSNNNAVLPQPTTATQYYKLTPTSTTATPSSSAVQHQPLQPQTTSAGVTPQVDNSYYNNRNPYSSSTPIQQQQPQLRVRNSFYNDVHQQQTPQQQHTADYSSYDMSGSQSTNDMYSRVSTAGYQQQPYRPATIQLQLQPQQMYNTNNNQRKYTGPVPEDPLTAADSYRNHMN